MARAAAGSDCKASEFHTPHPPLQDVSSDGGLGGSSEKVFGPLAILAVGYQEDEFARFRDMLIELEAEMIKLIPCSPAMLSGTLGQALSTEPGVHQQVGACALCLAVWQHCGGLVCSGLTVWLLRHSGRVWGRVQRSLCLLIDSVVLSPQRAAHSWSGTLPLLTAGTLCCCCRCHWERGVLCSCQGCMQWR